MVVGGGGAGGASYIIREMSLNCFTQTVLLICSPVHAPQLSPSFRENFQTCCQTLFPALSKAVFTNSQRISPQSQMHLAGNDRASNSRGRVNKRNLQQTVALMIGCVII